MEVKLTKDNFEAEVTNSLKPVLVDFWAEWCGPCRMLGPVLEEVAEAREADLAVGKVNVDEEPELAAQFGIISIPTLILFDGGTPVKKTIGYLSRSELEEFLG
ncbi:MAG TPA: thioredoxin [Clostridiales bacterium]|nr:thioredoxin [Clostridiales bacterium]